MSEDQDRKTERETPQTTIEPEQPPRELVVDDVDVEAGQAQDVKGGPIDFSIGCYGGGD